MLDDSGCQIIVLILIVSIEQRNSAADGDLVRPSYCPSFPRLLGSFITHRASFAFIMCV